MSVTLFVPLAYGLAGLSVRLVIVPSGSNEPLSTAETGTSMVQSAPALTVTFVHLATGGWFSPICVTVTVNVQELVLPAPSVAVQTTGIVPTGKLNGDAGSHTTVGVEQLSL